MMVRCGTQIEEASNRQKHASKSLNQSIKRGLSDSGNNFRSSKTVLSVSLSITSDTLLLIRMRLGYASTIRM